MAADASSTSMKNTEAATTTILLVTGIYLLCNIPLFAYLCVEVAEMIVSSSLRYPVTMIYARLWLVLYSVSTNAALNPIIYFTRIKSFHTTASSAKKGTLQTMKSMNHLFRNVNREEVMEMAERGTPEGELDEDTRAEMAGEILRKALAARNPQQPQRRVSTGSAPRPRNTARARAMQKRMNETRARSSSVCLVGGVNNVAQLDTIKMLEMMRKKKEEEALEAELVAKATESSPCQPKAAAPPAGGMTRRARRKASNTIAGMIMAAKQASDQERSAAPKLGIGSFLLAKRAGARIRNNVKNKINKGSASSSPASTEIQAPVGVQLRDVGVEDGIGVIVEEDVPAPPPRPSHSVLAPPLRPSPRRRESIVDIWNRAVDRIIDLNYKLPEPFDALKKWEWAVDEIIDLGFVLPSFDALAAWHRAYNRILDLDFELPEPFAALCMWHRAFEMLQVRNWVLPTKAETNWLRAFNSIVELDFILPSPSNPPLRERGSLRATLSEHGSLRPSYVGEAVTPILKVAQSEVTEAREEVIVSPTSYATLSIPGSPTLNTLSIPGSPTLNTLNIPGSPTNTLSIPHSPNTTLSLPPSPNLTPSPTNTARSVSPANTFYSISPVVVGPSYYNTPWWMRRGNELLRRVGRERGETLIMVERETPEEELRRIVGRVIALNQDEDTLVVTVGELLRLGLV
eukprot:sb/3479730/